MGDTPRFVPRSAELRHFLDRDWARREFMRAIRRRTPEVLEDLHRPAFVSHVLKLVAEHSGLTLNQA